MTTQEVCTRTEIQAAQAEPVRAGLVALWTWCDRAGISRATAYEWRKAGLLTASVTIWGRHYLTPADVNAFLARAAAGEFANKPTP